MCLTFLLTSFLLIMLLEKLHLILAQQGVVYVHHLWTSCDNLHRLSLPHVIKRPEACCDTTEEHDKSWIDDSSHSTFMHRRIEMTSLDHVVRGSWTMSFHFFKSFKKLLKNPPCYHLPKIHKMVWTSLFLLGLSFICAVGPTVFY